MSKQQPMAAAAPTRHFEYDFVRTIAMIFVVAVHSLVAIDFSNPDSLMYFRIMQAVFFTCNGMFFMLSGRFALTVRTDYKKYYIGKVKSIVLPMLVYFGFRTIYQTPECTESLSAFFKQYMLDLLGGHVATEYWFLFTLIGNLLLAPLMAKAFDAFTRKDHIIFVSIGIGFHLLLTVFTLVGIPFSYSMIFSGWSFYFYLGYSVEKIDLARTGRTRLLLAGLGCLIVTTILKINNLVSFVHDISPVFTVLTVAMYVFLLGVSKRVTSTVIQKVVFFTAKYSFGVYLVHMMVLETILDILPAATGAASIPHHLLVALITLVISLAIAFVVDNTVVKWLQKLVNNNEKKKTEIER